MFANRPHDMSGCVITFSSNTTTIAPLSSMTRRMRRNHCSVDFYTPLLLPTTSLCCVPCPDLLVDLGNPPRRGFMVHRSPLSHRASELGPRGRPCVPVLLVEASAPRNQRTGGPGFRKASAPPLGPQWRDPCGAYPYHPDLRDECEELLRLSVGGAAMQRGQTGKVVLGDGMNALRNHC